MKKKTKPTTVVPNYDDLHREMHDLVNRIMRHVDRPENWPLAQHEQIHFVREFTTRAKTIRGRLEFIAEAAGFAARDIVAQSNM